MSTESARKAAERKAVALIRNLHYYCGINEPEPNFCGKSGCGQYLTHEVHLRTGETEQEAGERILSAACQTVAPPSDVNRKLMIALEKLIPIAEQGGDFGQVCNGCRRNTYEFAQHSPDCPVMVARTTLKEAVERGAAPAVSTPRCPGCGSTKLDYLSTELKVICEGCFGRFYVWKLQDFAQFFQPAPSPPQTCSWAMMENGRVKMRCRLPQGHMPEDKHDYVAVAPPQGESK